MAHIGLGDRQKAEFDAHGFVRISGLFSEVENRQFCEQVESLIGREDLMVPPNPEFQARYQSNNRTFVNQHRHVQVLDALAAPASALGLMAGSLLSVPHVFHMSLVQVSDGPGMGISWHQDVAASGTMLNCLIYPRGMRADNGPLVLVPGSHRLGSIPPGDPQGDMEGQISIEAEPGDLVICDAALFHRVPVNRSGRRRYSVNIRFCRADADVGSLDIGVYRNGTVQYSPQRFQA